MIRRVARALGGLLVCVGLALGVVASFEYDEARDAWAHESARHRSGDPGYDAATSDALYYATFEPRLRARLVGWWIASPGWVLLALSFRDRRRVAGPASGRALHAAALLDGAALVALLAGAAHIEGWVSAPAWCALLGTQLAGIALALGWGAMATGASLGGRLTRTMVVDGNDRPAGFGRGFAALLLWPFGLLWAPIGLAFAPATEPPHLAWSGLRGVASQR
ncbi:MAG: hypothetical protein H6719_05040 [Sandaracinaceae bacterium]|nr:hypothetical protein [Sandaracinaceae bacterium]